MFNLPDWQRDAAPVPEIIQKFKEYCICPSATPFVHHKSKCTNSKPKIYEYPLREDKPPRRKKGSRRKVKKENSL